MTQSPAPSATRVVLLGASKFPDCTLSGSDGFRNAADGWRSYFNDTKGYGLPCDSFLLDCFDSDAYSPELLQSLTRWLRKEVGSETGVRDLFICYVGHGIFDHGRNYCLAIRRTCQEHIGSSSLRLDDLAVAVSSVSEETRVYLLLDACFSGSATKSFMSNAQQALRVQVDTARFPIAGVSMLCSSSHNRVSHLKDDETCTEFTHAALSALYEGDANRPGRDLTLRELCSKTNQRFEFAANKGKLLSVTHSPRQVDGDIASIPLFPNHAVGSVSTRFTGDAEQRSTQRVFDDLLQYPSSQEYSDDQRRQVERERTAAEVDTGRIRDWRLIEHWTSAKADAIYREIVDVELEKRALHDQIGTLSLQVKTSSARKMRDAPSLGPSVKERTLIGHLDDAKSQFAKLKSELADLHKRYRILRAIQNGVWRNELRSELSTNESTKTFTEHLKSFIPVKQRQLQIRENLLRSARNDLVFGRVLWSSATLVSFAFLLFGSLCVLILHCWKTVTTNAVVVPLSQLQSTDGKVLYSILAILLSCLLGGVLMTLWWDNRKDLGFSSVAEWLFVNAFLVAGGSIVAVSVVAIRYFAFQEDAVPEGWLVRVAASRFMPWMSFLGALILIPSSAIWSFLRMRSCLARPIVEYLKAKRSLNVFFVAE